MSISISELAQLPTAPTVSRGLREAAEYSDQGPMLALRRALFGTTTFEDFVAVITPEHTIAESVALIVMSWLIDSDVTVCDMPDDTWGAGYFAERVEYSHRIVSEWSATHTHQQLRHLFEAAADRAHALEMQA